KDNEFYVVTCHHCIDGQDAIEVCIVDESGKNFTDDGYNDAYAFTGSLKGSPSSAGDVRLIGGDKDSDLAVLKLTIGNTVIANSIVEAKIMDVEKYQSEVGEDVVAIGNPSGLLPGTVSAGIISYLGRIETVEDVGEVEVMQIDVQTNPGSSGGALFNMYGELIGITNAGNTNYDGLNFAIPLETRTANQGVISVVSQLIGTATASNYGYVSGRWMLGINVVENNNKVYIDSLATSSPAYKAGIRKGDYVSKIKKGFKSYTITNLASLDRALTEVKKTAQIGETITIQVNGLSDKVVNIVQHIYNDTGL
ncbi:MAG: trypsin-like serine protease, partial [Clostridiales bacterium]|nr:trypsin-like serine protease [Clostridiales bacterium]